MTTITASTTIGIYLSAPTFTNPVVIIPGITITGNYRGDAIYANASSWTISNAGTISGVGSQVGAIHLSGGGVVTNQATGVIGLPFSNSSDIYITGGAGTVTNAGTINAGVWLQTGGAVTNQAGGRIDSRDPNGGYGVGFHAGGTITNAGEISGLYVAIDAGEGGGTVTNQTGGTLHGPIFGVEMGFPGQVGGGGGNLVSQAGATITGDSGFVAGGTAATVFNAGVIIGTFAGTASGHGYTFVVGAGVSLSAGGIVINELGGTITGADYGVYISNGNNTVINAGTIAGVTGAVHLPAGQTDLLIVDPTAQFTGTVNGGNTIGAAKISTLELATGASSGTLTGLGAQFLNFGSIDFDPGANWFIAGNTAGLAGTISGFAIGDTIEASGAIATGLTYAAGVLQISEASSTIDLNLPGTFTTTDFAFNNVAAGADITIACFRSGTRISSARGEVTVEHLRVGEMLPAHTGDGRLTQHRIEWIGRRSIDCRRHPKPALVWPVRIRAGAFGPGQPYRDLFLSPDHAVFVAPEGHADGVLIPVRHLLNGTNITQQIVDTVTYWHIELSQHAVLLADGLMCETYLDTGHRHAFANGGPAIQLHPDFAARMWEAQGCARLVCAGVELELVRRRLRGRNPLRAAS